MNILDYAHIRKQDNEAFQILLSESKRQQEGIDLIPSENYASPAVIEALGSPFANKYSEGTPGRRYYGGQQFTDEIERLAIKRALDIFGGDHANVQPLSGAAANLAAYSAWLDPGDKVLGMDLSHGGHLTHGAPVTLAAQIYKFIYYKMSNIDTGEIDYDQMEEIALREKPKIILAGFSAYPRTINFARMAKIANKIGAMAMADMAHITGLIAAKVMDNPLEHGFHVLTTTTHKSLRGPRGAMIISRGKVGNPLRKPEKTLENLPTLIDRAVFPGLQGGPHMNKVLGIAVALKEASTPEFKAYGQKVLDNAQALAQSLIKRGVHLISGGTDNHLMMIDVMRSFNRNGEEIQKALGQASITVNKNATPDDALPPFRPSGVRLGTPPVTSRNMGAAEMDIIAEWICDISSNKRQPEEIKPLVKALGLKFPTPSVIVKD